MRARYAPAVPRSPANSPSAPALAACSARRVRLPAPVAVSVRRSCIVSLRISPTVMASTPRATSSPASVGVVAEVLQRSVGPVRVSMVIPAVAARSRAFAICAGGERATRLQQPADGLRGVLAGAHRLFGDHRVRCRAVGRQLRGVAAPSHRGTRVRRPTRPVRPARPGARSARRRGRCGARSRSRRAGPASPRSGTVTWVQPRRPESVIGWTRLTAAAPAGAPGGTCALRSSAASSGERRAAGKGRGDGPGDIARGAYDGRRRHRRFAASSRGLGPVNTAGPFWSFGSASQTISWLFARLPALACDRWPAGRRPSPRSWRRSRPRGSPRRGPRPSVPDSARGRARPAGRRRARAPQARPTARIPSGASSSIPAVVARIPAMISAARWVCDNTRHTKPPPASAVPSSANRCAGCGGAGRPDSAATIGILATPRAGHHDAAIEVSTREYAARDHGPPRDGERVVAVADDVLERRGEREPRRQPERRSPPAAPTCRPLRRSRASRAGPAGRSHRPRRSCRALVAVVAP